MTGFSCRRYCDRPKPSRPVGADHKVRGLLIWIVEKKLRTSYRAPGPLSPVPTYALLSSEINCRRPSRIPPLGASGAPVAAVYALYYVCIAQSRSGMKIEFLLIADAVEAVNGKLYVMGGCWDRHVTSSYPANVRLGIAISLQIVPSDIGQQKVVIRITDDQGAPIIPEILGQIDLSTGRTGRALVAVNSALQIAHSGRYEIHVQGPEHVSATVSFESNIALSS